MEIPKKTKIVCTIGPACADVKTLTEMVKAGMNVARLNFSHGDHDNHLQLMKNIRKVSKSLGVPVAILQDLHGPKIRVGEMKKPLDVKVGQEVVINRDFPLEASVARSIKPKQKILIEDGLIELEAQKVVGSKVWCTALSAGKIQSRKGVNLPRTKLKISALTPGDLEDLKFGLANDVDYVALSFVRSRSDILRLKSAIKKFLPKDLGVPKIIAKIEKPEAVKNFDSILKESDGIMVARGDLGVEISEARVPILQKTFIQKCLKVAKPVIVATQMLDSMIRNPRPTRAEVSDVANAVIDQTDAVMLSGETAFGLYPVQSVSQMAKIILTTEKSAFIPGHQHLMEKVVSKSEAISESVYEIATHTKAKVIAGFTDNGFSAREIAHERPPFTRIVMYTDSEKSLRQMQLLWGVVGYMMKGSESHDELSTRMLSALKKDKLLKKGDEVVIVAGLGKGSKDKMNFLEIKKV